MFGDAYREDMEPFTGFLSDTISSLKRSISSFTRGCKNAWIGITSDGEVGLQKQWNSKYKHLGMKHIAWVYSTSSERSCKNARDELVDFYGLKCEGKGILDNERSREGPRGRRTPYVVFVAWR